jgi:hypothetical protein
MSASYRNLAIEAAVWLASIIGVVIAIALSCRASPKRLVPSFVLALFALAAGYLGLWTPFSFLPRIAYSWANGDYRLDIDVNQFFIVPLVLGLVALVLATWRYWRSSRAAKAVGPSQV